MIDLKTANHLGQQVRALMMTAHKGLQIHNDREESAAALNSISPRFRMRVFKKGGDFKFCRRSWHFPSQPTHGFYQSAEFRIPLWAQNV
jgi:hypothetical protein